MKSQRKTNKSSQSASRASSSQSSARQSSTGRNASKENSRDNSNVDAVELIKADHRHVEDLFRQFESAEESEKQNLIEEICKELSVHATIEEEILYPACREKGVEASDLDEAQVEHDTAKILILELTSGTHEEYRDAKVKVLCEYIKHHVDEEESEDDGILVKASEAGIDMKDLGSKLKARKEELMMEIESEGLEPSFPSFHLLQRNEESTMARQYGNYQDRDEYGRFQGAQGGGGYGRSSRYDDDDYQRGGRGQGGGNQGGGGRDQGQGWYGDSEGHAQAAREGWRNREGGGGYGGGQRGRYEEDYGRADYGRGGGQGQGYGYGYGYGSGQGRGQGGCYGDSEGHAQASREGWANRRNEDDDRRSGNGGRSGYGYGGGRGGQGGWFGDSEGHSEAARRGWETRYGEGSYGRNGGSRSQGGDDRYQGRGQGHGGWYGDSEGHAEAARRGWRNRE